MSLDRETLLEAVKVATRYTCQTSCCCVECDRIREVVEELRALASQQPSAREGVDWEGALRDLLSGCGRSEETDDAVEKARAFLIKNRGKQPVREDDRRDPRTEDDGARMNWLQKHSGELDAALRGVDRDEYPDLRAAIDAARRSDRTGVAND